MYRISVFLFSCFLLPNTIRSQIFPKEGDTLNYRIIGFNTRAANKTGKFRLEIASGNYYTEDSFKKNIVVSLEDKTGNIIAEVPAFGCQYTWRVTGTTDNATQIKNGFHHFNTAFIPNVDTGITRLRILKRAEAYEGAYVFIDGTRTLYDMNGQPVWFFPNIEHFQNENFEARDMKITPQGTITFIIGENVYEVNYNASVLWRAPALSAGGDDPAYHHQATRLSDGHYMILGNDNVICRQPSPTDGDFAIIGNDSVKRGLSGNNYINVPFGTILEYDEKGNLVWSWRSLDYFKGSDIIYHQKPNGVPDITPHENGFYFDEKTKTIYVSFRNISRIIKVKYPEGNVINTYGEIYKSGIPEQGGGLFCHQHSCRVSDKGYLYLFNNNVCNVGMPPSIVMLQEPVSDTGHLKKIWEYVCTIDGINDSDRKARYQFLQGGNVFELPDHSIFASMCAPFYSKVFIVSPGKNILWSALPERKNPVTKKWGAINLYEASIISSREELERLIWTAQGSQ